MKKATHFILAALTLLSFIRPLSAQQSGNILSFDGVNDAVIIPNDAALSLTSGTIEAWMVTADAAAAFQGVFVKQFAFGLFVDGGNLITYDWTANAMRSTGFNVADGYWHHVCMSFQSGVANGTKIYVDGVLKLTTTITCLAPTLHDMTIGSGAANAGGQFFKGFVDEAHLWNTIRTPTPTTLVGNEAGLVAYYNFNQGNGNNPNPGVTTLNDLTTPANNGTLTGTFALTGNTSNWLTVATTLPAELRNFKATTQQESVKLDWTTSHEDNNKGFDIERLNQRGNTWETLGFVPSDAKNSVYSFIDRDFIANRTVNYYRLRQIDTDGKSTLSKVVSVAFNGAKSLKIYPNLVTDGVLNLELTEKGVDTEGASFSIINLLGQQVQSGKIGGRIDVSALPKGGYIVTVGTEKAKFIKQ